VDSHRPDRPAARMPAGPDPGYEQRNRNGNAARGSSPPTGSTRHRPSSPRPPTPWPPTPPPCNCGGLVRENSPFVSLSAGAVSREIRYRANVLHRAQLVANEFATQYGQVRGALIYCWVVTSPLPAVPIEAVAEELRDLNSNRPYSAFNLKAR
jgi:hypothetical protein